jgi:hypothetical protein
MGFGRGSLRIIFVVQVAEAATGVELNRVVRIMKLRVLPVVGATEHEKFPRSVRSPGIRVVHCEPFQMARIASAGVKVHCGWKRYACGTKAQENLLSRRIA